MENSSQLADVCFGELSKKYLKSESILCTLFLRDYKASDKDWIGLYGEKCNDLSSDRIAYRLMSSASIESCESPYDGSEGKDCIKVAFKIENSRLELSQKFHFKYVGNLDDCEVVLAESCTFEIEDGTVSSQESFLTIQAVDSLDDATVLVNKMSSGRLIRMEEDFKKICNQLVDAKKKIDEQNEYCEILQEDIRKKQAECEAEKQQRQNAEQAVEELGRRMAEQMELIDEQGRSVETLERKVSRESKLNSVLKEEMEGHHSVFEENSLEYEKMKMKAISLKNECKQAKRMLQNERDLFAEASSRYEEEMVHFKRRLHQVSTESNMKVQEAKLELHEMEEKLKLEKEQCVTLQSSLNQMTAEYDCFLAESEGDMQAAKEKIEELKQALKNEESKHAKEVKDHDSAVQELEKRLGAEKKKAGVFEKKYEETHHRAVSAEKDLAALRLKLREADGKLIEMEELVKGSKSELELLKSAVSAEEMRSVDKATTRSDSQIETTRRLTATSEERTSSIERRSEMLLQRRSLEGSNSKSQRRYSKSKSREESRPSEKSRNTVCSWEKAKEHTIHREVFNYNNESKRYHPRYYEKRRQQQQQYQNDGNANSWYNQNQHHQRGRDVGHLRQHRNSLLRENSRMRYTVSMLSHDCAILNYTLQQVVLEAEQKLESLYAMYVNKESQLAAYESQLQHGGLYIPDNNAYYGGGGGYGYQYVVSNGNIAAGGQYDQYMVPNGGVVATGDYVDGYMNCASYVPPVGAVMGTGAVVYPASGYTYCGDGYYEIYSPQQQQLQQDFVSTMVPAVGPAVMEQAVMEQAEVEQAEVEQAVMEQAAVEQAVVEQAVMEQAAVEQAVVEKYAHQQQPVCAS
eukprot:gene20099-22069_t